MLRAFVIFSALLLISCNNKGGNLAKKKSVNISAPIPNLHYGIDLNYFEVKKHKIKRGDTFGKILETNGIDYPQVYAILEAIKGKADVRKLTIGKPYSLFFSNDSIALPEYFVYHPSVSGYTVIHLQDSLYGNDLTYYLSDVYAWTVDFFRLQKGDRFKIIYTEKFVDDSISIGIERIKAAYFEHKGKPLYAFEYISDPNKGIVDYFDDNAKSLRRAFLQGPLKFNRVSSRYNLRRRIAYYGNRIRPHKGTDFAASVGTPILATANGSVVKSGYTKGNGNYVTLKHNSTYSTQYLHMKKRKVKTGQFIEQGEIIGWVGMTGNTSGPHVCYRFWKNGRQVDPFKQKLPDAKPISKKLQAEFSKYIIPYKTKLDCIPFETSTTDEIVINNNQNKNADPS